MNTATALQPAPILSVDDLWIGTSPAQPIVQGISFTIASGEVLGIVGESGSGKTLTAYAIAGLLPSGVEWLRGRLDLEGRSLGDLDARARRALAGDRIGVIFQDPLSSFNPVRTIGSILIESGMRHQRLSPSQARQDAVAALTAVRLPDAASVIDAYPHQLSGGQRQRAMIALARFNAPALLIADEPTTALDPTVQLQILALLKAGVASSALLLITHDLSVAAMMCDRILVMHRGHCVETGTATQILRSPQHPYTQQLLAASQTLRAVDRGDSTVSVTNPNALLEVRNVSVRFATRGRVVQAARDCSLQLDAGEVLALVGESASGKSTLARVIAGIVAPTSGSVHFRGHDLQHTPRAQARSLRQRIQMVFQDPDASLNPMHSVGGILAEPLIVRAYGDRTAIRRRIATLLELVHLDSSLLERRPHELSGGEKQRVAIARALAMEPEVLIADEPLSSLDVSTAAAMAQLFVEVQRELGIAMLFISHDLAAVRRLATRVAVLLRGEIVETGPCELLDRPAHPYTRQLLAAVPNPQRPPVDWQRFADLDTLPALAPVAGACHYRPRCSQRIDACLQQPGLASVGQSSDHLARCHLCRN